MSARAVLGVVWVGFAGCTPLPPEPMQTGQLPEFTVLTATPGVGSMDFSLGKQGHLEGTLTLERSVETTHPIRLAVVWREPQFTSFARLWSSLLLQADQQVVGSFPPSSGTHAFVAELALPPAAAVRVESTSASCTAGRVAGARATLVAFVDVNENGQLDLSASSAVDHVLSSSDFPTELLGDQRARPLISFEENCSVGAFGELESRQPLFEHPLLDLVSCTREDRFAVAGACGNKSNSIAVVFSGERIDDRAVIQVSALPKATVQLDGEEQGFATDEASLTVQLAALAAGQHRLRATASNGAVWEALFTFPDRTWIKSSRQVGGGAYEIAFQEVPGATGYRAIAGVTNDMLASGTASPLRLIIQGSVGVTAVFGDLPFTSGTQTEIR